MPQVIRVAKIHQQGAEKAVWLMLVAGWLRATRRSDEGMGRGRGEEGGGSRNVLRRGYLLL